MSWSVGSGAVGVHLGPVVDRVAVRVGIGRVGAVQRLVTVEQSVAVGVDAGAVVVVVVRGRVVLGASVVVAAAVVGAAVVGAAGGVGTGDLGPMTTATNSADSFRRWSP